MGHLVLSSCVTSEISFYSFYSFYWICHDLPIFVISFYFKQVALVDAAAREDGPGL